MLCPVCALPVKTTSHEPGTVLFVFAHHRSDQANHQVQFTSEAAGYDWMKTDAIELGSTPPEAA